MPIFATSVFCSLLICLCRPCKESCGMQPPLCIWNSGLVSPAAEQIMEENHEMEFLYNGVEDKQLMIIYLMRQQAKALQFIVTAWTTWGGDSYLGYVKVFTWCGFFSEMFDHLFAPHTEHLCRQISWPCAWLMKSKLIEVWKFYRPCYGRLPSCTSPFQNRSTKLQPPPLHQWASQTTLCSLNLGSLWPWMLMQPQNMCRIFGEQWNSTSYINMSRWFILKWQTSRILDQGTKGSPPRCTSPTLCGQNHARWNSGCCWPATPVPTL